MTMQSLASMITAVATLAAPAAAQYFHDSKVDIRWNRLYTHEEIGGLLHDLVAAYPELLSIETIGQSEAGRDLWVVTLNNPDTGPDTSKAAMWIDGNIHGNEIQAAETVLYSIWYLTKSYGRIERLTKLIDERAFYFQPMVNPDGRQTWFDEASTPHFLRGGIRPTDNDYDGLYDEDPYDDLDGDGHITSMYMEDPTGRWERDPDDDRFFRRVGRDDPPGGWTRIGSEGIDNDGDGRINEDGPGGYDPNRNWPSDWRPNYIQFGAGDYPFSFPETRAIGEFLIAHPNVAAFQSYHNTGGMILRGPGAKYRKIPGGDVRVHEAIMEKGETILPFYDGMILWKDLYKVHGGEVNWAYEGLGIIAFTNELWTDSKMMGTDDVSREQRREFRDLVQFGDVYVPYTEVEHPTYGTVLVGGTKKYSSRIAPPFMLEEDCHRNFAFTMHHADEMPLVTWGLLAVRQRPSGVWEITVQVVNDKIIPTITALAAKNGIGARDTLECRAGDGAEVVASGTTGSFRKDGRMAARDTNAPHLIWNDDGIGSKGREIFRFLVSGSGSVELEYRSQKGGTLTLQVPLEEREPTAVED